MYLYPEGIKDYQNNGKKTTDSKKSRQKIWTLHKRGHVHHMTNKHMKRCLMSFLIRKVQFKYTYIHI